MILNNERQKLECKWIDCYGKLNKNDRHIDFDDLICFGIHNNILYLYALYFTWQRFRD